MSLNKFIVAMFSVFLLASFSYAGESAPLSQWQALGINHFESVSGRISKIYSYSDYIAVWLVNPQVNYNFNYDRVVVGRTITYGSVAISKEDKVTIGLVMLAYANENSIKMYLSSQVAQGNGEQNYASYIQVN